MAMSAALPAALSVARVTHAGRSIPPTGGLSDNMLPLFLPSSSVPALPGATLFVFDREEALVLRTRTPPPPPPPLPLFSSRTMLPLLPPLLLLQELTRRAARSFLEPLSVEIDPFLPAPLPPPPPPPLPLVLLPAQE